MRKRTFARECVLKILYQADVTVRTIDEISTEYWLDEEIKDDEVKVFVDRLLEGINQNLEKIDRKISDFATNWQLKRMAIIDRNILRLGVFELKFAEDIPPKVSINEAVELAKKFGDLESSKFVNGILDKIHKLEISKDKTAS